MFPEFRSHVINDLSFLKGSKLLLAVSGGLDSVMLTHLCRELNLNISLVHCNFNLRGDESDADEQFVMDLGDSLDLEVFIESFETKEFAKKHKMSIQMAARKLRYDWFDELAEQLGFDYILTAHHADDNLETFLINLSRGTGLDGLTGIPETNEKLVRPLLPFSRMDLEAYAKMHKWKWREDSSNESDTYLRNALRHHVVPKLKELNPQMITNFNKTTGHLQEVKKIVEDRVHVVASEVISETENGELQLDIKKLKKLSDPKAYLFQLLKEYGFSEWNDIVELMNAQSGKQISSSTYRLIKNRNELILSNINKFPSQEITIGKEQKKVNILFGYKLLFDDSDTHFGKIADIEHGNEKSTNVIFVDKDLLNFPLSGRGWRRGDYFYPLGMKGRKKLSKYFKDEKLSLLEKERTQILCSGEDIIWVMGRRADDRFKVTDKTEHILKITIEE